MLLICELVKFDLANPWFKKKIVFYPPEVKVLIYVSPNHVT